MQDLLQEKIRSVLNGLGLASDISFTVEHPADMSHGDWSSNVAIVVAKQAGKNPQELAEQIIRGLQVSLPHEDIKNIEVAGPGFINIRLSDNYFERSVQNIINQGENNGRNGRLQSQKTIIEFTDPNPFKKFHIGHMMSMTIGEALCGLAEWNGAEVQRAVYQGDLGLHVAKAVWGMVQNRAGFPQDEDSIDVKIRFLSNSYAFGAREYEYDERAKQEIIATNKMLYEQSNHELNIYYEKGRSWSLEDFETIYARIGTKFDLYFLESEVGEYGKQVVLDGLKKGTFEESDGAVVYKGEKHGLHTRVFINSQGIPTYEAKELGLAKVKAEQYAYDRSIVLTGNEQDGYFKVLLKALSEVFPDLAEKTTHLSHGMLRLPEGKMSSRTGDVIAADTLIDDVKQRVLEKMADRDLEEGEKHVIAEKVAMGAIKYSVLKQAPNKDIIFDIDKSLNFEGDSGPYLQYTAIRARSILDKAQEAGVPVANVSQPEGWEVTSLEKILNRFPEIITGAYDDLAPQQLVTYLTEVAAAFNSFYGNNQIIDANDPSSPYKVGVTEAVSVVLQNGLSALGIPLPEKM